MQFLRSTLIISVMFLLILTSCQKQADDPMTYLKGIKLPLGSTITREQSLPSPANQAFIYFSCNIDELVLREYFIQELAKDEWKVMEGTRDHFRLRFVRDDSDDFIQFEREFPDEEGQFILSMYMEDQ